MTKTNPKTTKNAPQKHQSPYEAALDAALNDLGEAQEQREAVKREAEAANARVDELTELVRGLLAVLPPQRAAVYAQRLEALRPRPAPSTRAGPVHDNVVDLFARSQRREWSASEVQTALAEEGQQADPKAVYNVLDYLVRKGNLRRAGRGRYFIVDLGVGIELGHDIDGADRHGGGCMED